MKKQKLTEEQLNNINGGIGQNIDTVMSCIDCLNYNTLWTGEYYGQGPYVCPVCDGRVYGVLELGPTDIHNKNEVYNATRKMAEKINNIK